MATSDWKSTESYNVSRAHVYNWNGRFIDGSTDNISRGRPKYKNCRKMKSAHDGIDCHWRRIVLEVAEMSGISKYTAQHTLTSDFSVTLERSLHLIDFLKLLLNFSNNNCTRIVFHSLGIVRCIALPFVRLCVVLLHNT